MLLDDRRIVLTLEAICWCTAAMVFFQQTDFPRAMAILPLLMGVLIRVEYPPPGRGVGAAAEAVPGLTFEEDHAKHAAGLFDKEGALLRGHAYVLTFLRRTPASLKQMPRMARLSSGCEKVRATLHFVAVFAGDDDAGGPQAAAKKGQRKEGRQAPTKEAAGKDATPGVLMATNPNPTLTRTRTRTRTLTLTLALALTLTRRRVLHRRRRPVAARHLGECAQRVGLRGGLHRQARLPLFQPLARL